MDYQNIQRLILSNEKEIAELEKHKSAANDEKKAILVEQNKKLNELMKKLKDATEQYERVKNDSSRTDKQRKNDKKEFEKTVNEVKVGIKSLSQGKTRNLFSSYIGQIDKRIHNLVYGEKKNKQLDGISERLHKWSSRRSNERYGNPLLYMGKNVLIGAGVFLGLGMTMLVIPPFQALMPALLFGEAVFGANTVAKTIASIYNKVRYGKNPEFPRRMEIRKGSYSDNIEMAQYDLSRQRECSSKILGDSQSSIPNTIPQRPLPKVENHDNPQKQLMNDRIISEFRSFDIASADLNRLIIMYAKLQPVKDNLPIELKDKYNKLYLEYMKKKKEYESAKTTLEELDKIDIDAITAKDIDKINELITKCQKYFSYATDDQKKKLIALTSKRNILVNSPQPVQKDGSKLSDEVKVYFEKLEKLDINTLTIQNLKDMNELISDYQKKYHSFATEEQTKKYNALLEKRRALTAVQRRAYEDDKIKKLRDLLISITVDDIKDTVSKMGMIQSLSREARKNCYVNLIALKKIFSLSEEVIDFIHDPILLKKLKEILSVTSKEQIEKMSAILPKRVNIHYYEENSTATLQFYGSNSQRPLFEINISDMSVEKVEEAVRIVGFDGDIYITKHSSVRKK